MRILVVSNVGYIGGAETVLKDLITADQDNTYAVVLPRGDFSSSLAADHIEVLTNSSIRTLGRDRGMLLAGLRFLRGMLSSNRFIGRVAKATRSDLIYANSLRSGVYCILPSLIFKIPMIWHVHDIETSTTWKGILHLSTKINPRIHVVAVSRSVFESPALSRVPVHQKSVIYNGLDTVNVFNPRHLPMRKMDENVKILMYGRVIRWKGFHVLIEALGALSPGERSLLHCTIAGSSPDKSYMAYLKERVDVLKIHETVEFIGPIDRSQIPELIQCSDVVVHASVEPDPLPTVIIEAMAMGKYVIASQVGGVAEIIDDGTNGFLFPSGDSAALAELLRRSLRNPNREAVATEARTKVEKQFSIATKVQQMNRLYQHLKMNI